MCVRSGEEHGETSVRLMEKYNRSQTGHLVDSSDVIISRLLDLLRPKSLRSNKMRWNILRPPFDDFPPDMAVSCLTFYRFLSTNQDLCIDHSTISEPDL